MARPYLVALALVGLAASAGATVIPPSFFVEAVRPGEDQVYAGFLADPHEGRSWLWVSPVNLPFRAEPEGVFVPFNVTHDVVALATPAGRVLHESWDIEGEDWFRAEQLEGSQVASGRGQVAGFVVVASHHT